MKTRLSAVFVFAATLAIYAPADAVAQDEDSSALMVAAAEQFVSILEGDQRALALFPFEQDLWEAWHFIPMRDRTGLTFGAMTGEQIRIADTLMSSCLSRTGYHKAKMIMSVEKQLFDIETAAGGTPFTDIRDADGYYFAVFGTPSTKGVWGWRLEGHHISIHFAMRDGEIISSSPLFLGANPHELLEGPRKGWRSLGREEDVGRALLDSLNDQQLSVALTSDKAPRDVLTGAKSVVAHADIAQEGLQRSKMTEEQQGLLQALISEYIFNVPRDLAERRIKMIEASGDDIYFVWMGSTAKGPGNPHYYRVQSKTFLIEYDNTQNNANHSHTVWRDYENDFARDVLADHYRAAH